jgi:peptidoglycan/LPS O-acetylase OafA/YrhL
MFGLFRFVLALLVVGNHLGGDYTVKGAAVFNGIGNFAVYGFFVVSGYLMTLVLNQTYQFNARKFWLNRFLRLYPSYYFVCAFAMLGMILWPDAAAAYHETYRISSSPSDWLGLLTIFTLPFRGSNFRPVPPIWSVGVELVMYFLLFAFIARRPRFARWSGAVALGYTVLANLPGRNWDTYSSLWAALLPFSLGALIYFHRDRLIVPPSVLRPAVAVVGGLWLCNLAVHSCTGEYTRTFYLNLLLCAGLVVLLSQVRPASEKLKGWDKFVGDLAYPVFLLHWGVGLYVSVLLCQGHPRGIDVLGYSLPLVIILSALMIFFIDRPLEKLRRRIRPARPTG